MNQYRVISVEDPAEFQRELNLAAEDGYSVVSSYSISDDEENYFVAVMELSW